MGCKKPTQDAATEKPTQVGIIIDIRYDESKTKINADDYDQPDDYRYTASPEGFAMHQHKNAVRSHNAEDCPRCSNTHILRSESEAGDDADDTCHQVNKQEAQVSKNAFDDDAQHEKVEHIKTDMQNVGMQEDRCHKAPVLPGAYGLIIFGSIGHEYIPVLRIAEYIGQDVMQGVRVCSERDLVGCDTPHDNRANGNDPGDPGKAFEPAQRSIAAYSSVITQPDGVVAVYSDHMGSGCPLRETCLVSRTIGEIFCHDLRAFES